MTSITDSWKHFHYFQSAASVQALLKKAYLQKGLPDADINSYGNCYPFMYFLEQGEAYYEQSALAPLSVRPVLLFYGLIHLIKACLLTTYPLYPENTSVLAHGVSARKRKKKQYQFIDDEVKIQKHGLCTHMAKGLFHVEQLEGTKWRMRDLLMEVPELNQLHRFAHRQEPIVLLKRINPSSQSIPEKVLDDYHMNASRFKEFLSTKHSSEISWLDHADHSLCFIHHENEWLDSPFRFHSDEKQFGLPSGIRPAAFLPELLVHYLLLYNLSMIARYETEWWMELIKTAPGTDLPFISTFLDITATKTPFLIIQYLSRKLTTAS